MSAPTWQESVEEYIDEVDVETPLNVWTEVARMAIDNMSVVVEAAQTVLERYNMIVSHALKDGGIHVLQFQLLETDATHHLFEVHCLQCDWWDHWDETTEIVA